MSRSAIAGSVLWVALLFIPLTVHNAMADVAAILLLGILVVIPLATEILGRQNRTPVYRVAVNLQPIGAVLVAVSFFFHESLGAAALTIPWLLFSHALAIEGVLRLKGHHKDGTVKIPSIITNIGLVGLPVGAVWLFLSRLGAGPGKFGELIVLLTAVHFHFAAFIAPVWAGLLGSQIRARKPSLYPAFCLFGIGLVLGTPIVALGIAATPLVETLGVVILATSAFGLGVLGLLFAPSLPDRQGVVMLMISSVALCAAMAWAFAFNLGPQLGWAGPDIIGMIPRHGWIQAVGFALVGILGWRRLTITCNC